MTTSIPTFARNREVLPISLETVLNKAKGSNYKLKK